MSIKHKILISNIIMLVVPVILILVITVIMVGGFVTQNPEVSVMTEQTYDVSKYMIQYFIIWGVAAIAVTALTAGCITAYLSRSIIRPIKELDEAMQHIKAGDLHYEFAGSSDVELKELCESFEDLRVRLQESVEADLAREREQKMLMANISHDLKTPITSIKGYIDGIMEGVAGTPEMQEKYLKTIRTKTELLESMVENLSLYSKLELKRAPYDMEIGDICGFLAGTVEEYLLDLQNAEMQVECHIPSEEYLVKFDRQKMHRVFSNIIQNAMKYKKEGTGHLTITVQSTENGVAVNFEDTGIGIKNSDLKKVFEGFYRSDPSRNSRIEGNGLGLAITRQIVEDHSGKIWIRSEEGIGTEVVILLPRREQG